MGRQLVYHKHWQVVRLGSEIPRRDPSRLQTLKLKRLGRLWAKLWWDSVRAAFFNKAEFLQLLSLPFFLFVLILLRGSDEVGSELVTWTAAKTALLWALLLFAVFAALVAALRVRGQERKKGQWIGTKFLSNEPQLAFTTEWVPTDNGSCRFFVFRDAERNALVHYKLEIEGPTERVWGVVLGKCRVRPEAEFVALLPLSPQGKAILGDRNALELRCFSQLGTVPCIVRVYILSWELFPEATMEYEQKGIARVVLAPPTAQPQL